MTKRPSKVVVLFGGRAPEHEVSIITGIQVLNALVGAGFSAIPVYVSKDGRWYLGDKSFFDIKTFADQKSATFKRKQIQLLHEPGDANLIEKPSQSWFFKIFKKLEVDVFFPCFHGRYGEDGSIQGLLELADVAYVGCGVQASAIGMDKVVSKRIAKSIGIPTLRDNWAVKSDWQKNKKEVLNKLLEGLQFPVFVKPVRLGSSIGVSRVSNRKELIEALKVAFFYDTKVMVEEDLKNSREVNVSLLGNNPYECSVTEELLSSGEMLSFEDKYITKDGRSKGMASTRRVVPAKIKKVTEDKLKRFACDFFAEIDGSGICRVDFLISSDEKEIYFNEVNTIPGSLAFYLWKHKSVNFSSLVRRLINLAIERKREKDQLVTTFDSNILEDFDEAKASKLKI